MSDVQVYVIAAMPDAEELSAVALPAHTTDAALVAVSAVGPFT